MTTLYPQAFGFPLGAFPSQPAYGRYTRPGTVFRGANYWKRGDTWIPDKGSTSVGASGSPVYLQVVDGQTAGMTTNGNVCSLYSTKWFAGTGNAIVNGLSIGVGTGFLNLIVGGVPVSAG